MSSSAVYCDCDEHKIDEESKRFIDLPSDELNELDGQSEYHMVKCQLEEYAKKSNHKNWTIVRPNLVFSPSSLRVGLYSPDLWCYRAIRNRTIVLPSEIMDKATSYLTANDAAKIYEIIIGNKSALSQAYNIASEYTITLRKLCDYLRIGFNELGYNFKIKEVPLEKYFVGFPSTKSRMLRDRAYNRHYSMDKVKQLGNYVESDIEQNIIESAKHNILKMKDNKQPFKSIIHGSAWMDRLCHEHTSIKEIEGKKNKIIYLCARYVPFYKLQMNLYRIIFK